MFTLYRIALRCHENHNGWGFCSHTKTAIAARLLRRRSDRFSVCNTLVQCEPRETDILSWFTLHQSIAHWKPIRSSSQQWRRNRRSCVRTEALSFMIFVAAQKLSREARTISLGKKIHIGETTRNDEWQDVSNQAAGHFNRQN